MTDFILFYFILFAYHSSLHDYLTLGVSHEKLWIQHVEKDIFNARNVFSAGGKGRVETHGLFISFFSKSSYAKPVVANRSDSRIILVFFLRGSSGEFEVQTADNNVRRNICFTKFQLLNEVIQVYLFII